MSLTLCIVCKNARHEQTRDAADCADGGDCGRAARKPGPVAMAQLPDIDADAVLAHTKVLSSDEFEGRAPGTKGEELTVDYLVDQFKKIGLKPGNTDGTYIQKVPLVGITPTPAPLVFAKGTRTAHAQMERRCRRVDEARGRCREHRQVRAGLRRLRRRRARVQLGRLQGRRRERQDARDARRRSARARSRQSVGTRSEDVRRQRDDVLRPLDVQVRDRRDERRGRRADRSRNRPGRLRLQRRPGQRPGSSSIS